MLGRLKLLTAAVLGLALAAAPVAAQDIHINPVPPHVKPQWTPVPNVSGVFYAPNLPTDVFRRGTKYYFYWQGYLYRASKPRGRWKAVTKPPEWFSAIDPALFKTASKEGAPPPAPPAGPSEGVTPAPPIPPLPEAAPPPPEKERAPATPATPTKPPNVM